MNCYHIYPCLCTIPPSRLLVENVRLAGGVGGPRMIGSLHITPT